MLSEMGLKLGIMLVRFVVIEGTGENGTLLTPVEGLLTAEAVFELVR